MTDTLPSWATEKARQAYADSPIKVFGDIEAGALVHHFAKAIAAAYQQGNRDGQRRMKERARRTGYRICAETRHVSLGDKVEAAIRAMEVKP